MAQIGSKVRNGDEVFILNANGKIALRIADCNEQLISKWEQGVVAGKLIDTSAFKWKVEYYNFNDETPTFRFIPVDTDALLDKNKNYLSMGSWKVTDTNPKYAHLGKEKGGGSGGWQSYNSFIPKVIKSGSRRRITEAPNAQNDMYYGEKYYFTNIFHEDGKLYLDLECSNDLGQPYNKNIKKDCIKNSVLTRISKDNYCGGKYQAWILLPASISDEPVQCVYKKYLSGTPRIITYDFSVCKEDKVPKHPDDDDDDDDEDDRDNEDPDGREPDEDDRNRNPGDGDNGGTTPIQRPDLPPPKDNQGSSWWIWLIAIFIIIAFILIIVNFSSSSEPKKRTTSRQRSFQTSPEQTNTSQSYSYPAYPYQYYYR